jgi:nucleolar protein 9
MRKENRKRGKKRRRDDLNPVTDDNLQDSVREFDHPTPSWIISRPKEPPENNAEAPFGYVDADVKAYFRTVDIQVRQWQDNRVESSAIDNDSTPSEGWHFNISFS